MKLSIRIHLDEIVSDRKFEEQVLNALMEARKIKGKQFKVIFWNKNLSEKDIKNFIKRNETILFKMSTQITKKYFYIKVFYII